MKSTTLISSSALSAILSLLVAIIIIALSSSSSQVAAMPAVTLKHGDVMYDPQLLPTHYRRVRVTFYGSNFSTNTRFRLSNTSQCADGAHGGPTDTLSDAVSYTNYDKPNVFVATFDAKGPGDVTYACVSTDGGTHYFMAKNTKGRYHFRLWGRVPTSKIAPLHPTVGRITRVFVKNLPSGSRAALVTDPKGCDGPFPSGGLRGGNATFMTTLDATTSYVDFAPRVSANAVYVCVATPPTLNDWTLAPFDQEDSMIFRGWNYDNVPDPSDMITGHITSMYFKIYPDTNNQLKSYLECSTPIVAGKAVRCYVWVQVNETGQNALASDFAFLALTDGAGVDDCPFPSLVQENVTHVYFDWTAQRWGREGHLSLMYQNVPIKMALTFAHSSYAALPNTTHFGHKLSATTPGDDPVTRFMVLPGDVYSVDYGTETNLLALGSLAPLTSFNLTLGVPAKPSANSTLGFEADYMTLNNGVQQAVTSQTVAGLTAKSRCKFRARYAFWPDTGLPDQSQTSLVGRASIISRSSAPADIEVVRHFYVYVQGSSMIVTGTDLIPLGVTGDIRQTESIGFEFLWRTDQDGFRFEFEIYHQQQRRFYWSEPEFKCLPTGVGGETLAGDITALQNIYNAIGGGGKKFLNWRNPTDTAWNGDPCTSKWVGLECRNGRIVELNLAGYRLDGALPADIGSLSALEVLRLGNNKFAGALPDSVTTLDRLRVLDIQNNAIRSLPTNLADATTNVCLRRLFAQRNVIDRYPNQTINHPRLESLRLEWNSMFGTIPNYTNPAVPMRELSVAHNRMTGWLPPNIPFQTLVIFDLSDNQFDGPIPVEWSQLKNMQYLDISHNAISGSVPAEYATIRSGNMLTFRAQDNYIGGLLPRLPFESYDLRQNVLACPSAQSEDFSSDYKARGLLYDDCDFASLVKF